MKVLEVAEQAINRSFPKLARHGDKFREDCIEGSFGFSIEANYAYERFKYHLAGFGTGAAVVSVAAVVATALVAKIIYNKVKKSENKA